MKSTWLCSLRLANVHCGAFKNFSIAFCQAVELNGSHEHASCFCYARSSYSPLEQYGIMCAAVSRTSLGDTVCIVRKIPYCTWEWFLWFPKVICVSWTVFSEISPIGWPKFRDFWTSTSCCLIFEKQSSPENEFCSKLWQHWLLVFRSHASATDQSSILGHSMHYQLNVSFQFHKTLIPCVRNPGFPLTSVCQK